MAPTFDEASGRVRKLHLRSGDALLFGGPCRFVKHAVLDVNLNELPAWMAVECGAEPYRLSLTFRDATSVLGREEFFRRFDVSKGWFRQTQRAWRPGSPPDRPPDRLAALQEGLLSPDCLAALLTGLLIPSRHAS